MNAKRYCIVGRQPWNRKHYEEILKNAEGEWDFIASDEELAGLAGTGTLYRFVFFLHWSKKVPIDFLRTNECVCFHMTDVPYGRGGSPLQNLIARGHKETKLTALKMTSEFDAGPVYLKTSLSLEHGTAEEIFIRASKLSCELALAIARDEPVPVEQSGVPVNFKRRAPSESALPINMKSLEAVFDHIRMLDCEGYPNAFLDFGKFRLTFRRASLHHDCIDVDVTISEIAEDI